MSNIQIADLRKQKSYPSIIEEITTLTNAPNANKQAMWAVALCNDPKNSKLLAVAKEDPFKLLMAVLQVVQVGLDLNPIEGYCTLIPYGGIIKPMPMYRGIAMLLIKHKVAVQVQANVVCGDEPFEFDDGDNPSISHKIGTKRDMKNIHGAWCIVTLANGKRQINYMDMDQINKARAKAQTQKVWNEFLSEQCKKTVLKNTCKLVFKEGGNAVAMNPISKVIALDNEDYLLDIDSREVNIIDRLLASCTLSDEESESIYLEIMGGELPKERAKELITRLKECQPLVDEYITSQTRTNTSYKNHPKIKQ